MINPLPSFLPVPKRKEANSTATSALVTLLEAGE